MSLLCDIADKVLGKECAQVQAVLGCMAVREFTQPRPQPNTPHATLRTVLLCESPHVDEVCHGHALAGKAGRNVSAALHIPNGQFAIGCLLTGPTQHRVLDSLGLMNVSLLPLQKTPYCANIQQDDDYRDLLCAFSEIRDRTSKGVHGLQFKQSDRTDEALITMMRKVCDVILCDLKRRLCQLPNCALVIPCGNVARNFLRQAEGASRRRWSEPLRTELSSLGHPSEWSKDASANLPQSHCLRKLLALICTRAGYQRSSPRFPLRRV